jgi:type IV secretory pathway VirB3-like protein
VNLKQKVLKALANPPRIFYVPYNLAILNFFFWFLSFVVTMVVFLVIPPHDNVPMWLPLAFLGLLSISHMILGFYSKQDSQIAQIVISVLNIFNKKIPRRLKV